MNTTAPQIEIQQLASIPVTFATEPEPVLSIGFSSQTSPRKHEGRGSKNKLWGKGPSLLEQRDFLNGLNREECRKAGYEH